MFLSQKKKVPNLALSAFLAIMLIIAGVFSLTETLFTSGLPASRDKSCVTFGMMDYTDIWQTDKSAVFHDAGHYSADDEFMFLSVQDKNVYCARLSCQIHKNNMAVQIPDNLQIKLRI